MIVRDAVSTDAAAMARIANHYIRDTTVTFAEIEKTVASMEQSIATRHAQGHGFVVAQEGAHVIGYASFFPFRSGSGYRHTVEHTVQLVPEAVGRGAGRLLMTELERIARDLGIRNVMAGISGENEAAIVFHRKLGFDHEVRLPQVGFKFGRWIDLVLMQKRLFSGPDSR